MMIYKYNLLTLTFSQFSWERDQFQEVQHSGNSKIYGSKISTYLKIVIFNNPSHIFRANKNDNCNLLI